MYQPNLKIVTALFGIYLLQSPAGAQISATQTSTESAELLRFLRSFELEACVEDVPAPSLMLEPRFTKGQSNTICFRLPETSSLPFDPDRVHRPFVITQARNVTTGEVLSFPRTVDLTDMSPQFETMNDLNPSATYSYSIALFLPVCKVDCDAVVDSTQLELHCSSFSEQVTSTQDDNSPEVQNVAIPQLDSTQIANWWNRRDFSVTAELGDSAGIWQGAIYRRNCDNPGWQSQVADTIFPGSLTDQGYEFATSGTAAFTQSLPDGCYDFLVIGRDASHTPASCSPNFELAGNVSDPDSQGAQITIHIDTTPPGSVALLCRQIRNSIELRWSASNDGEGIGLAGYKILRDGVEIASLAASTTLFRDAFTIDTPDMQLAYQVRPFDYLDNIQQAGGSATCPYNMFVPIDILDEPEYTAGDTNQVIWTSSSQIDSYSIFIAPNGDFDSKVERTVADTFYTFTELENGTTYSFWVEAVDRQGRAVTSDTVSSIQDSAFPQITTQQILNMVVLGDRNWVASRDIHLSISGRDSIPGKIKRIEIFEDDKPRLNILLQPAASTIDTSFSYSLESASCLPIVLAARVIDVADNASELVIIELQIDEDQPQPVPQFVCSQPDYINGMELTWEASAEDCSGLAGYRLLRDGTLIATVPPDSLHHFDVFSPDTPSNSFGYEIQPFDSVGHVQEQGGSSSCDYVGTTQIVVEPMAEFTPGLSNSVCWQISYELVTATVYLDLNCDSVAEDSVVIENPSTASSCRVFDNLVDGGEYCYWISGVDFQQRQVRSEVVSSIQDNSPPVIDSFTFPAGEPLNDRVWAYSQDIDLHLSAHDLDSGEIWSYIIVENELPEIQAAYSDSLPVLNKSIPYHIMTESAQPTVIELSVQVVDGAGNKSQVNQISFNLQRDLPAIFAFPNPFNPMQGTPVTIRLRNSDETEINVYDFFGNLVTQIIGKENSRDFVWDGRNDNGEIVANGGYICIGKKTQARFKLGVVKQNQ